MDMETMCGKMVASTKVITSIIRSMAKELIHILMEANTGEHGRKACSMEWAAL